MKYLKIQNGGLLDIRLIGLMGGTTKKDDQFKIGQFGTGLKYVLSYLIRNNIDFKIFIGEQEIKVTTESEIIRDQEFNIISIDGKRTSITCQMGFDWEAWMIIREIWCNALDEGGEEKDITDCPAGAINTTSFFIQVTPEIKEVIDNWTKYFIHGIDPVFENHSYRVYTNGKGLKLYKQGVLIYHDEKENSLLSYDIKNAELNELREFKGTISYEIMKCIVDFNPKTIEYFLEHLTEDHYEGSMDYSWSWVKFSDVWKKTIGDAKLIHQKAVENIQSRELDIDLNTVLIVPRSLFTALIGQFEGISYVRVVSKMHEFYEGYLPNLEFKIKEALTILESCDYWIDVELKFIYGSFADKTKYAQVNLDTKEVFISEQMLDKSMFEVVAMLIEENEHFKTGFQDCSRPFQSHWINLFTKTLLDSCKVKL